MNEIKDENRELIITDIKGDAYKYYIICRFQTMNKEYIALAPQTGENVVELFRCFEDDKGKIGVADVVSDMELDAVKEAYRKINANEVDELLLEDSKDTTLIIKRDDGSECVCEIVSLFEYDSKDFIALMPLESAEIISRPLDVEADEDAQEEVNLNVVLYGYNVYDNNKGNATISLLPIPAGQYPSIEAYFMELVMADDEGVEMPHLSDKP